jgi:hypothetical protein
MGKQDRGRDVCKNGESGGGKMRWKEESAEYPKPGNDYFCTATTEIVLRQWAVLLKSSEKMK